MSLRDACLTYTLPSLKECQRTRREAMFHWLKLMVEEPP